MSSADPTAAADVFQRHRDELGFVNRAQCRDGDLLTVDRDGRTVAAALGNHCVRKPQTTLYELAVLPDYRRQGIASTLITRLARQSPHSKLIAKCPTSLPAMDFYADTGWERIGTDDGKHRQLAIWEYPIPDGPDIITTGRPDLTRIAAQYGWLRGSRLDDIRRYERANISLDFVDLHWEDPQPDALVKAAQRHEPKYVVAGDYDGSNFDDINDRAARLRDHAANIIIVPHEPGEVERVPDWAVVGYSTPSEYAGTSAPVWEYSGRDVHLLGGTVSQLRSLYPYLADDVVSIDCNSFHRGATQFAKWWAGNEPHWRRLPNPVAEPQNAIRAYENTMCNLAYVIRQDGIDEFDSWRDQR